jgi:membrane protease YdiL (CAAX protease family)
VPWTGPLVAVAFLVFSLLPEIARLSLDAPGLVVLPLQVAAWFALLKAAGAPLATYGLSPHRAAAEVTAAYRTWLVLTPIVYLVSGIVLVVYGLVVGKQPDEHPIVQSFQSDTLSAAQLALLILEAVLAAPVREELFFRGVLLPWLAQRSWGGDLGLALAVVAGLVFNPSAALASRLGPVLFVLALVPLYRFMDSWPGLARWLPVRDPEARRRAARAIFGAAALFANFHASVWPTPIPLFVLALGLGWLAYRTQSVVAPIIVHMMFNALVFGALYLKG